MKCERLKCDHDNFGQWYSNAVGMNTYTKITKIEGEKKPTYTLDKNTSSHRKMRNSCPVHTWDHPYRKVVGGAAKYAKSVDKEDEISTGLKISDYHWDQQKSWEARVLVWNLSSKIWHNEQSRSCAIEKIEGDKPAGGNGSKTRARQYKRYELGPQKPD